MRRRFLIPLAVLAAGGCVLLLFTYEIINVDWVSFMEDQPAVDYQDPPRKQAAELAIAFDQPSYKDEPANIANPVPADEVSLQRGGVLFGHHCAVCHGSAGQSDGPVTNFWKQDARRPANLSDARFRDYPDGLLYRVITQGIGAMPPLRENMTERQYWDVVNHVHTLQP